MGDAKTLKKGSGNHMTKTDDKAVEFVRKAFTSLWPVHLSSFNKLLIQLRTAFDGDFDLMLVLAVIGERTRPESWQPEPKTYRQLTRRSGDQHLQVAINIQSVAEYSGIPRETVRRKVRALQEKGWVERDGEGLLTISSSAAADLEQSTMHSIRYLAAISSAIQAINRDKSA
ncbi:helix-turn-helix domain-containing protein [Frigidibacter sp. RF13]|uniref:helix-turn-helix domain-containing protein n=1 Tax=Frigidibacter sp. RF13 TaxID=2997340 RepID=UPI00226D5E50|nr:helix-turn-helix domain-containing protein [Frigidibacter sp. RF13]MCY1128541.1 helix-turn-helix domain-containing protein [Frigidibacter sp. RF13]